MRFRQLTEDDYDTLSDWWRSWDWEPVSKALLPDGGVGGLMVEVDGVPVCAGFLYKTNSGMSWVDWIISSREFRGREQRRAALKLLIQSLTELAKIQGYAVAYALIKHKGLQDVYEELGYTKGDTYNQEMIKTLWQQ